MNQVFKGKKVAILGLSTEGLDSAKFFLAEKAFVHCCDRRSLPELGPKVIELQRQGAQLHLGKEYLRHNQQFDMIVRTPGMALFLPELQTFRQKGIITSLTKLFFELCPAPIVGVTGTKGKGTTTALIGRLLRAAGYKTHIGGNIGEPLLSKVREIHVTDRVVLELSSFQLEDMTKSPHVAVVLNITSDHLANADPLSTNFHHTLEAYVDAKKNLVKFQTSKDFAVINADYPISDSFGSLTSAKVYRFSRNKKVDGSYVANRKIYLNVQGKREEICSVDKLQLRGEHNWENITAAITASVLVGASLPVLRTTVPAFKGLEHRLELVREVGNIKFYNDSFSTTPETAIAAIRSFTEPLILIAGGSEKNSNYEELGREIIKSTVKALVLIGPMAEKIEQAVRLAAENAKITAPEMIKGAQGMEEVFKIIQKLVVSGDVVLLSPACASFGMFKNYKERGTLFKNYAQKINL